MIKQRITLNNEIGAQSKAARSFAQMADQFKSGIWIEQDERRVNAKGILGILSVCIAPGAIFNLIADGPDEREAVMALAEFANHFGS